MTWSNWDPLLLVLALLLGVVIGWAVRGRRSTPTPTTPFVPAARSPQPAQERQPAHPAPSEAVPAQHPAASANPVAENAEARTTWPSAPAASTPAASYTSVVDDPAVHDPAIHDPIVGDAGPDDSTPAHRVDDGHRTDEQATSRYADDPSEPADRWAYDTPTTPPHTSAEPQTAPATAPEPVTQPSYGPAEDWRTDPDATTLERPVDDDPAPHNPTVDDTLDSAPTALPDETVHTTLDDPSRDTEPLPTEPVVEEPGVEEPVRPAAPLGNQPIEDQPVEDEPVETPHRDEPDRPATTVAAADQRPTPTPAVPNLDPEPTRINPPTTAATVDPTPLTTPDAPTVTHLPTAPSTPAPAVDPPTAPDVAVPSGATAADDFRRLAGVGPKVASALHAAGIHTFGQLADTDVATLREAVRQAGVRSAPNLATWPEQARTLAR